MQALAEYAEAVKEFYKRRLIADDKVASGNLLQSVETYITSNGSELLVTFSVADYFRYVEYGRKPGKMPPVDKIINWVKVRNIMPEPKNGKLPTPEQLGWAISKKIARDGILPTYAFADTLETVNNLYLPILQEALQEDFDEYVISMFADIGRIVKI